MCLASTGDNAYPKPSVAVQQLDGVVDDVALQQPRPGTASPLRLHVTRLMIGSDMSGKCALKKCT